MEKLSKLLRGDNIKNKYIIKDDKVIIYLERKRTTGEIFECVVELSDLEKLMQLNVKWFPKWSYNAKMFYPACCRYLGLDENGKPIQKTMYLFRYLLDAQEGECVDHIDHNPMNNIRENLRLTVINKNTKHRKSKNSNNKSGYRNVFWATREEKWTVALMVEGKHKVLGTFDDVDEAGMFAEQMREKYYGEFKGKN